METGCALLLPLPPLLLLLALAPPSPGVRSRAAGVALFGGGLAMPSRECAFVWWAAGMYERRLPVLLLLLPVPLTPVDVGVPGAVAKPKPDGGRIPEGVVRPDMARC